MNQIECKYGLAKIELQSFEFYLVKVPREGMPDYEAYVSARTPAEAAEKAYEHAPMK